MRLIDRMGLKTRDEVLVTYYGISFWNAMLSTPVSQNNIASTRIHHGGNRGNQDR